MHRNNISQAVKQVPRLTEKAKAAVEETATAFSRKCKTSDSGATSATAARAVVKKAKPNHDGKGPVDKPPHATARRGKHITIESSDKEHASPTNQDKVESVGQKSHSPSTDEEEDPKETAEQELSMSNGKSKL